MKSQARPAFQSFKPEPIPSLDAIDIDWQSRLGAGGYSVVRAGTVIDSGTPIACKIIQRETLGGLSLLRTVEEKKFYLELNDNRQSAGNNDPSHPTCSIMGFHGTLKNDSALMFILERISGWDLGAILSAAMLAKCLSSQVSTKSISPRYQLTIAGMSSHGTTTPQGPRTGTVPLSKGLSPSCVLSILSRLIEVIEYLHGCGIAHRDIKPKNIMLSSVANSRNPSHSRSIGDALCTQTLEMKTSHSTSDAFLSKPDEKAISCTSLFRVCELKLVDFGSARHKQRPRRDSFAGTPHYMSPERLHCMINSKPSPSSTSLSPLSPPQPSQSTQSSTSSPLSSSSVLHPGDVARVESTSETHGGDTSAGTASFARYKAQDWWGLGCTGFELLTGHSLCRWDSTGTVSEDAPQPTVPRGAGAGAGAGDDDKRSEGNSEIDDHRDRVVDATGGLKFAIVEALDTPLTSLSSLVISLEERVSSYGNRVDDNDGSDHIISNHDKDGRSRDNPHDDQSINVKEAPLSDNHGIIGEATIQADQAPCYVDNKQILQTLVTFISSCLSMDPALDVSPHSRDLVALSKRLHPHQASGFVSIEESLANILDASLQGKVRRR